MDDHQFTPANMGRDSRRTEKSIRKITNKYVMKAVKLVEKHECMHLRAIVHVK